MAAAVSSMLPLFSMMTSRKRAYSAAECVRIAPSAINLQPWKLNYAGRTLQLLRSGMFAAVVIVFLPTFFLYIFLSEKIIAGVTAGGVKG